MKWHWKTTVVVASLSAVGLTTTILTATPSAALAAQKSPAAQSGPKPVFLGTYPGIDPYQAVLKVGAAAAAKALGVTLVWRTPETFDTAQQLTITEDGLSIPNLKGMSVVAADPSSLEGVVREALAKGLGVSQLAGCSPKSAAPVCYDSEPSALGATAAMHMGRLMHGSGDVVVASGVPGNANDQGYVQGAAAYFHAHYPNIHIVQTLYNCDQADNTVNCAEAAVTAHPNLKGYLGAGNETTIGAETVFPQAGIHPIVGTEQDDPVTVQGIKKGSITFTQVQPPYCQGYLMVLIPYEEVYDHLSPVVKYFNTGAIYVDASNINTYKSQVVPDCQTLVKYVNSTVMKPKKTS